ncbi:hypothetical protein SDC9_75879 [bioreactor metagenome]|uniref:Uncharacterized protein n=1 Tax=bioreactor metagenome TaxID=1076179 RepID=A0A644YLZ5_9ZZZZ
MGTVDGKIEVGGIGNKLLEEGQIGASCIFCNDVSFFGCDDNGVAKHHLFQLLQPAVRSYGNSLCPADLKTVVLGRIVAGCNLY